MTAPRVARSGPTRAASSDRQAGPGRRQHPEGVERPARDRRHVRLARPARRAEHPAGRQAERERARPSASTGRAAVRAGVEQRHQPQLAEAGQLEPEHPPVAQTGLAQVPERDDRRVEQLRVWVVEVGQFCQTARRRSSRHTGPPGRGEGTGNARRARPRSAGPGPPTPCAAPRYRKRPAGQGHPGTATSAAAPLRQPRHLAQLPREQRDDQAGLEDLDRPQDQRRRSDGGHGAGLPRGLPTRGRGLFDEAPD